MLARGHLYRALMTVDSGKCDINRPSGAAPFALLSIAIASESLKIGAPSNKKTGNCKHVDRVPIWRNSHRLA